VESLDVFNLKTLNSREEEGWKKANYR